MKVFYILTAFLLLSLNTVWGEQTESTHRSYAPIIKKIEYFEDHLHQYSVYDVFKEKDLWQSQPVLNADDSSLLTNFHRGYSSSTWWIKIQMENPYDRELTPIIEVGLASLDELNIFLLSTSGNLLNHYELGDLTPSINKTFGRFNQITPSINALNTTSVIVRVRTSGLLHLPIFLWNEKQYTKQSVYQTLLLGGAFGLLVAALVYGIVLYLSESDKVFLSYMVMTMSCFGGVTLLNGGGYLIPGELLKTYSEPLAFILLGVCVVGFSLFFTSFWQWGHFHPEWHDRLKQVSFSSLFVFCPLFFFLPANMAFISVSILSLGVTFLGIAYGIKKWQEGRAEARFYLAYCVGNSCLVLFLLLSHGLGWGATWLTELYILPFYALLCSSFSAMAVVDRNTLAVQQRLKEHHQAYRLQKVSNEALQNEMTKRISELDAVKQQLKDITKIDAITGLKNKQYMDEVLAKEFSRCQRYERWLAIANIDIDQIEDLYTQHGSLITNQCLKAIGDIIKENIRTTCDLAVHHERSIFYLILPETDQQGALCVIEKIQKALSQIRVPLPDSPVDQLLGQKTCTKFTASIGLYVKVPEVTERFDDFLNRADTARYYVRFTGMNKYEFYTDEIQKEIEQWDRSVISR